MFHHESKSKHKSFPYLIFRLMLSFCMLVILSLGVYQAFKYFSGTDPLKMSPQAIIVSSLGSLGETGGHAGPPLLSNFKKIRSLDDLKVFLKSVGATLVVARENRADIKPAPTKDMGNQGDKSDKGNGRVILKFAVVSDSHEDNDNLANALKKASDKGAKFVIGLGDYTKAGGVVELQAAKTTFQKSSLPFYLTPGDHDLWESRDKRLPPIENFNKVFGVAYQSFSDSNIRFVILNNSDNYLGVSDLERQWLRRELQRISEEKPLASFVFMHEPLYHPSSDHIMGKENPKLLNQSDLLLEEFKEANIKALFAGHIHFFSEYKEPKKGLEMIAVGALTNSPNTQKPRFVIVEVYEDGSYNIQDLEI